MARYEILQCPPRWDIIQHVHANSHDPTNCLSLTIRESVKGAKKKQVDVRQVDFVGEGITTPSQAFMIVGRFIGIEVPEDRFVGMIDLSTRKGWLDAYCDHAQATTWDQEREMITRLEEVLETCRASSRSESFVHLAIANIQHQLAVSYVAGADGQIDHFYGHRKKK